MVNEKRLITENDIYALFGRNGKAELHVADIDLLPRVDAVEVVRCKDCKSWKCLREDRGLCKHPTFTLEDDDIDPLTNPDDFCSYGERKDNELVERKV